MTTSPLNIEETVRVDFGVFHDIDLKDIPDDVWITFHDGGTDGFRLPYGELLNLVKEYFTTMRENDDTQHVVELYTDATNQLRQTNDAVLAYVNELTRVPRIRRMLKEEQSRCSDSQ